MDIFVFLIKHFNFIKMIRFLFLAVLSFSSAKSFCQHTQLNFSDEFKIAENDDYKDQTVANSVFLNNLFYTATNSGIGGNNKWLFTKLYDMKYAITIASFDKNMKKIRETQLENGSKVFGPLQPRLLLINNKLCLAYFQSDDKASFNLYLSQVDENLKLKEPKKICNIQQENVGIFKLESVIKGGIVFFTNTTDNSKTLVVCNSGPNSTSTFVVDGELNIIKKSVIHTNTADFKISKALLTNDNLECLVLQSERDTKLVCINPEGKKTETKINLPGGARAQQVHVSESADRKNIYVYSSTSPSEEDGDCCSGFFLATLNSSTLQLAKPLLYKFSPEFTEEICKKGGGSKHKKDYLMYNFEAGLVELSNGEVAIVGSPQEESVNTSSKPASALNNKTKLESTTTLNTGPILAFYPNKNGKTFEYAIVPRISSLSRSAESGSGIVKIVQSPMVSNSSAGFVAVASGDDIIILYNDNEDNLAKDVNEKTVESHSTKNMVLAEALIDKDKKLQYRKQLGQNIKGAYTYFLGNIIPVSSSALVFPVAKQGVGFNARKIIYTNWCFLGMK
ncbi:hypothetical protein EFY79_02125 [Hanamia caeni]|uniref:Uncharacterized protein n=2 Tax=Hanamia caeni TaxID=2294116 RepID=A0A3M9NRM4_9BACT|nr:hypothetical protein EFY79_02125 [Hanamia caeni]